jgi:hypothetical protein
VKANLTAFWSGYAGTKTPTRSNFAAAFSEG